MWDREDRAQSIGRAADLHSVGGIPVVKVDRVGEVVRIKGRDAGREELPIDPGRDRGTAPVSRPALSRRRLVHPPKRYQWEMTRSPTRGRRALRDGLLGEARRRAAAVVLGWRSLAAGAAAMAFFRRADTSIARASSVRSATTWSGHTHTHTEMACTDGTDGTERERDTASARVAGGRAFVGGVKRGHALLQCDQARFVRLPCTRVARERVSECE